MGKKNTLHKKGERALREKTNFVGGMTNERMPKVAAWSGVVNSKALRSFEAFEEPSVEEAWPRNSERLSTSHESIKSSQTPEWKLKSGNRILTEESDYESVVTKPFTEGYTRYKRDYNRYFDRRNKYEEFKPSNFYDYRRSDSCRRNVFTESRVRNKQEYPLHFMHDYSHSSAFGNLEETHFDWYNQDTPSSKFELLKRFLKTDRLKSILEDLEGEFNSKLKETESLREKNKNLEMILEREKARAAQLKSLCRDRVLKERELFLNKIKLLNDKVKKYRAYIEKMRSKNL